MSEPNHIEQTAAPRSPNKIWKRFRNGAIVALATLALGAVADKVTAGENVASNASVKAPVVAEFGQDQQKEAFNIPLDTNPDGSEADKQNLSEMISDTFGLKGGYTVDFFTYNDPETGVTGGRIAFAVLDADTQVGNQTLPKGTRIFPSWLADNTIGVVASQLPEGATDVKFVLPDDSDKAKVTSDFNLIPSGTVPNGDVIVEAQKADGTTAGVLNEDGAFVTPVTGTSVTLGQ